MIPNTDEMEPGTFKDRILVGADPHQIIEGTILAGYANQAQRAVIFIRPSYELEAEILEGEFAKLREANLLGTDILGSGFDFDITLHRSAGRYICGEASAQVKAIQGERPRPDKESHMTDSGLWGRPTIVNNVETLACLPHILRHGAEWFKGLALTPGGDGTKLFGVSGMVNKPDCYETPMGTPLREIIFEHAGGMKGGREFKACLTGGASTKLLPAQHLDVAMDFESLAKIGHRLGTGAIIVFDQGACLVSACLNLLTFFARESCGWCTPCREGLPYMRHLLLRIELGDADEGCVKRLREMAHYIDHSYCAFAPGAAARYWACWNISRTKCWSIFPRVVAPTRAFEVIAIMPRLTIDHRAIEVPKGTKVIQAAEQLGIYIPRFCFHEALGAVGACRMCAVMFLDGPVKGLEMSCMTEAREGMVVSTDHPEAQDFRRQVIEWLMLNHPHDCPVCDEGGQCLLQDMTVSSGHGIRRYEGDKRTFRDQDLGPFVSHEMNRCIHCWRCRRFYQEYAGYRDLGAMQIGRRTYFGRQRSGVWRAPLRATSWTYAPPACTPTSPRASRAATGTFPAPPRCAPIAPWAAPSR